MTLYKVDVPISITYLNWTSFFKWYVVMCGSKNGHKKYMYLKEIGLRAQYMMTILGSIVNIIGRGNLYDHLMSTRIFTLIMNKKFNDL